MGGPGVAAVRYSSVASCGIQDIILTTVLYVQKEGARMKIMRPFLFNDYPYPSLG